MGEHMVALVYDPPAEGGVVHIAYREPAGHGRITVNMDRMVYEPVFFHA